MRLTCMTEQLDLTPETKITFKSICVAQVDLSLYTCIHTQHKYVIYSIYCKCVCLRVYAGGLEMQ